MSFVWPMLSVDSRHGIGIPASYGEMLLTPKLDGMRCMTQMEQFSEKTNSWESVFSRNGKPIPNIAIRQMLSQLGPGFDGELMPPNWSDKSAFKKAISLATTINALPDPGTWQYCIFNYFGDGSEAYMAKPFSERWADCKEHLASADAYIQSYCQLVEPIVITDYLSAQGRTEHYVKQGLEGGMLTFSNAPYCSGKRTNWSMKLKPTEDAEAVVIGFKDEAYGFGKTIPEHLKGQPKGMVGSLVLQAEGFEPFSCGSGLDHEQKKAIFADKASYLGKIVTFKYQGVGSHNKPRQPIFKTFRHEADLL